MRTVPRYLALVALMFWLGGFTFYASIVVPIGTEALGSTLKQGFITRRVTQELNVAAAVALAVLLAEEMFSADPARGRRWTRLGLWLGMVLCQAALFWLHAHLDTMLQVKGKIVLDREAFRPGHRIYLWTHTVQWLLALVYVFLMLGGWRGEDGRVK